MSGFPIEIKFHSPIEIKVNNKHLAFFFIISCLFLFVDVILCYRLKFKSCFLIVNIIQIIYILTSIKLLKNDRIINCKKIEKMFFLLTMELTSIIVMFFIAKILKNGFILESFINIELILLSISIILILLKSEIHSQIFVILNLFGFISSIVVFRSSLHILNITIKEMILLSLVTYIISIFVLFIRKAHSIGSHN